MSDKQTEFESQLKQRLMIVSISLMLRRYLA